MTTPADQSTTDEQRWLTRGVAGIGTASLLADLGHAIPTTLLPSLLQHARRTRGRARADRGHLRRPLPAPALADDPARCHSVAVSGYTGTALLASLIGTATAVWQSRHPASRRLGHSRPPRPLGPYTLYNIAATLASVPAGRLADRMGNCGPLRVLTAGVALFALAYLGFAAIGANLVVLALPFFAAGLAIGCVETVQHSAIAALAPAELRGSAFGLLATIQAGGNFVANASAIAGVLWTVASAQAAFLYLAAWMLALVGLALASRRNMRS